MKEKSINGHRKMKMQSVVSNVSIIGMILVLLLGLSYNAFTNKIVLTETVAIAIVGAINGIAQLFLGMKIGEKIANENKDT